MAGGIDASIPLGVKTPDTMSTIGSIVGIAKGATELQRSKVALEQDTGALDARKAIAAVVSNPEFRAPDGTFDLNKATPAIIQADPRNYHAAETISKLAGANNDLITVKRNALGLADASRGLIGSTLGAFATRPDLTKQELGTALTILEQQAPDAKPAIDVWRRHLDGMSDDPRALQQAAMQARSQIMPASAQIESQTPSGPVMDTGQQAGMVNVRPTAGPAGIVPATVVQKVLPPTTPTFDQGTQTPGYLGPQPGGGAPPNPRIVSPEVQAGRNADQIKILQAELAQERDPKNRAAIETELRALQGAQTRGQPFSSQQRVQSGPSLGTAENVAGTVEAVNKDWAKTTEAASTASTDIGILQNIKKYAPGAVTGVASDRQAFVAGLAGKLGMTPAELAKTDTDLLAKNSAMLAMAGGNTDLARTFAEAANPNTKMTKEAIQDAANQVIAQRKLALVKQQYMAHFKGDPEMYSRELAAFNQAADPRILQLPEMSAEEKMRMKAAMSPTEQKEFEQKIRKAQALGLLK